MHFVVDAQLPPALARWLESQGYGAEHVADLSLDEASDRTIWDYALAQDAVIITKDEDFALRRIFVTVGPAVVWIRLGNTRKGELLRWFEALLPEILTTLARGEVLVEVS